GILVESTNDHLHTIEKSLLKIRQAEARLKTYSEQLEQIVEARTRELSDKNDQLLKSNRELVIAKEEAVKRAKARADFLANMSHEIRTPFNGVLGMISLTMEEPLTERQKRQLDVAYNSGVSLLQVLNDILDISKVEAGKLTLESISFDLRKTIDEVTSLLAQNSNAKNIYLRTYIDPQFPERVYGDPTRIRQVISNLIGNAIKFTEHGGVSVFLGVEQNSAVLRVEDTGIGISRNALHKIFSPFSQAYSDTTRKYGGTGLGLTLCKQLVTHMSGSLEVDSEEDVGSCFTVRIPLREDISHSEPPVPEPLSAYTYLLLHSNESHTGFDFIRDQLQYWKLKIVSINIDEEEKLSEAITSKVPASGPTVILTGEPPVLSQLALLPDRFRDDPVILCSNRQQPEIHAEVQSSQRKIAQLQNPVSRNSLQHALLGVMATESPTETQTKVIEKEAKSETNEYSILLVEDNQVNQMVAKAILKKLGYQVKVAANGKEAVDILQVQTFDAVLMDCHMPLMDGYEATRTIRNQLGLQDIPIIAVTANVMHGDKEKCFSSGMNDYVTKPYERHVLVEKLEKWINRKAA
ncbi:MAG: ATP-binding protein, partial [Pseudomonadales bacterium]|nr:ATP-binding protein [Pseudomonadales bacterium]